MRIIPLQAIPSQRVQAVLDGQNCTITIYWRFGRLYCDLSVGLDIAMAGQVCLDMRPIPPFPSVIFSGKLCFVDMQGNIWPQWQGLGSRWMLVYLSDGETLESVAEAASNG